MLGFGGHFLTKSRYYSVTFRLLGNARAVWQRTVNATGPGLDVPAEQPTVLIVNFLDFIGSGWLTNRRRQPRQHSPRTTRSRQRRPHPSLGPMTAQPSARPCTRSFLDNSTVVFSRTRIEPCYWALVAVVVTSSAMD